MATGNHIRNPLEMLVEEVGSMWADAERALTPRPKSVAAEAPITIRRIGAQDLRDALRRGMDDLGATRADVLFIGLIYAVGGLLIAQAAFNRDLLPLVFPLVSGFALVGPLAAIGLYEISRQRERGEPVGWASAFGVLRSPSLLSILALGALLLALLVGWLIAASAIYSATLGPEPPASMAAFAGDVVGTPAGWALAAVGTGVGFLFAIAVFAISVVAFPLLLDRPVGVYAAIGASIRAVAANPTIMALWGLIVAASLFAGSIPALLGLIVVLPLLGHATWHLYRKVVEPV